jgi:glycosyltransferase involved in cell wall biosynthesis
MKKRICFVCTHSLTLRTLYKGLFPYLIAKGWSVTAIVGDTEYNEFPKDEFGIFDLKIIPMRRMPSPRDIISIIHFIWFFSFNRFDVIHISTPKASLLASIAARLTFNGGLIFVYRRCVYEMMSGRKRQIYRASEVLTCRLAAAIVPISRQIRDFLIAEAIAPSSKIHFIGQGSSNGIDVEHYAPSESNIELGMAMRQELGIPLNADALVFIGRMCREKGVDLLPAVYENVAAEFPDTFLIAAGPDDERDPIAQSTADALTSHPHMRRFHFVTDTRPLYALATVFVFPSFFEGFGNVLLEAAAMERVSVGFHAPGVEEAVADGESGLLVPLHDVAAFADAVKVLLRDSERRKQMEHSARARVCRDFSQQFIWGETEKLLLAVGGRK